MSDTILTAENLKFRYDAEQPVYALDGVSAQVKRGEFVAREKRRGNTYDGIIMDPPSYGRGPGGEIWKLEDCIYDLISQCEEVLSDTPLFFAVNSYTTGLSPAVMEYMLKTTLVPRFGGETSCDEIGLPVSATGGVVPCGATAIWEE